LIHATRGTSSFDSALSEPGTGLFMLLFYPRCLRAGSLFLELTQAKRVFVPAAGFFGGQHERCQRFMRSKRWNTVPFSDDHNGGECLKTTDWRFSSWPSACNASESEGVIENHPVS
jgi:hypothetical protein